MVSRGIAVYDQANRLTSATVGGTTTTYTWDGDGKRASSTTGGSTTRDVYDTAGGLPLLLSDGTRTYVYGASGLAYTVSGTSVEVAHADGLGSVRALTDGSGTLLQTYRTDPFGVPTATQGGSTQPFGFTGEQVDTTGLVYLRARRYDPQSGRFLQRDVLTRYARPPTTCSAGSVLPSLGAAAASEVEGYRRGQSPTTSLQLQIPVRVLTRPDLHHQHLEDSLVVVHAIEDAKVTDADPKDAIGPLKYLASRRPGIGPRRIDCASNAQLRLSG